MTIPNILLLGSQGQVGWELQRALAPLGHLVSADRAECDLAAPDALARLVAEAAPRIIVNAAAHTAVDKAESEPELAARLNAGVAAQLADEARARDALLIHYSTDYVFDGSKAGAYREEDKTNPLSVYGLTKRQGEEAILASGCRHAIFRTSWVFAARGGNFAKTMLRLAAERETLSVIDDQIGAPTSAELLADVTSLAIRELQAERAPDGLYHLVAAGETSWHGYASFVIEEAARLGLSLKCTPDKVRPIPTSAYPLPARRPANSRLATDKLVQNFNVTLPDWQYHVRRMLDEIYGTNQ